MSHLVAPIKLVGDVIDTVHLLEHVTLELQCQIGNMPECNGLTCNYWDPENRFDIFIECEEPELAMFSCKASLDLFHTILYRDVANTDIHDIISLAKTISNKEIEKIDDLKKELPWSLWRIEKKIKRLEELGFPFPVLKSAA